MPTGRQDNQDKEVRRQATTRDNYYNCSSSSSSSNLSSNLLESTKMHDGSTTTSGSGCSQSQLVSSFSRSHIGRQQQLGINGRWHLLGESAHNVMPIRVSSTLDNLDTQRTDLNCRSPKDRSVSARALDHHYCKINASSMVATLWALGSFCLLLMLASPGQCAPTTTIVSHAPVVSSSVNLHNENNEPSLPVRHHHAAAATKQQVVMTNERVASGVVGVQPIIIANPVYREHSKQQESSGSSVTPAALRKVDKFVADDDDDESSVEDETILLVLAGESSPSSIRRLMKRSGISDQRLAEIQMIRALKKQMERAAIKIAAESGGNGGNGAAGGDVK